MDITERVHVPDHDVRRAQTREWVRNGLWVIPLAFMLGGTVLGIVLYEVDEAVAGDTLPALFEDDPAASQALLSTIATSIITFASLVISVTVVALQLASQQFSPRVLRTFFRDTTTKIALGIFVGTFVYTLVVIRQIDPDAGRGDVPRVSVTMAFVLAIVALATFVFYVNHVVHAIRIVTIVDAVAADTRAVIREVHVAGDPPTPESVPDRPPDLVLRCERAPGAITTIDEDDLVAVAERHGCLLVLLPRMGQFVPSGAPLAHVWSVDGSAPTVTAKEVLRYIGLARERTMTQDVAFGFRQLVDIAEKALSPAVNDPTTAVQVLGRIHDLLRRIALAPAPSGYYHDERSTLRLVVPVVGWDDLVGLACDEIRHYGASSLQVQRRMRSMFADLATVVPPDGLPAIERQVRLLDTAADRHFPDVADNEAARLAGHDL